MNPHAVVFDAYGTLFDVLSVVARADEKIPGDLHLGDHLKTGHT